MVKSYICCNWYISKRCIYHRYGTLQLIYTVVKNWESGHIVNLECLVTIAEKTAPTPHGPQLAPFLRSSFSTCKASTFVIFAGISQEWHLWALAKLSELVWNSTSIVTAIHLETFELHCLRLKINIENHFKVCAWTLKIVRNWGPSNYADLFYSHKKLLSGYSYNYAQWISYNTLFHVFLLRTSLLVHHNITICITIITKQIN